MSINRRMDKADVTHVCNGILLSHKRHKMYRDMNYRTIYRDMNGYRDCHTE